MTHFPEISQLLESALKQDPSRVAIILGDKSYSYKDLDTAANIIASHFRRADLAGERVAFMLPNGFEILTSYLACFRSGAISMPLNRRYAQPELHRVLANALPKWLIIESDRLALLNNLDSKETGIEKIFVVGQQSSTNFTDFNTLLEGPEHFTPPDFAPQQPAVIFYTSGSTGEPKGVVHTHRSVKGILESTASALDGVTREDIILVCDPQCHISGFIETLTVLVNGGMAVLHDGFDLDAYLTSLEEKKPTLIVTHIDIFLKLLDSGRCTRNTFSSLRGLYTGGDDLPGSLQKRFFELTGKPIQLGYGMTEAIWLTVCRRAEWKRPGCIGKPVSGVELRIVDSTGSDLPAGEVGEIWVKGDMVMSHYWNNEQATKEAFVDGWFRTGDCASRDESGAYWFSGRIKNIIIRNTSNIMPGEVEEALYKHPDVAEAAVIGVPDPDEGHVPVAFVATKSGATLTEQELKDFALKQIAAYKTPARIYFIERMPLTPSGKIDHKKLYDYLPN